MKNYLFVTILSLLIKFLSAQDTFSICAVDASTGEVGSAGASCINGSVIISDVHPGVGVIHTQAAYIPPNQQFARTLMNSGLTPQEIVDSMIVSDATLNPTIRQYGVSMLVNGQPQAKAYTGINCMDYKNHIEGINYTIQGNILLGQHVLDSMEARFLNTQGDLACKLMAAMQGAKIVGADTRCMSSGNSSLSAFIRVAKPTDSLNNLFVDINVQQGPVGFEPIDSLQNLFDMTHNCITTGVYKENRENGFEVFPNPAKQFTVIKLSENSVKGMKKLELINVDGKVIYQSEFLGSEYILNHQTVNQGMYLIKIYRENLPVQTEKLIIR